MIFIGLASGKKKVSAPFRRIAQDQKMFFFDRHLPPGFVFADDPSHLKVKDAERFVDFIRQRQKSHPGDVFRFHHYLNSQGELVEPVGNDAESSAEEPDALPILSKGKGRATSVETSLHKPPAPTRVYGRQSTGKTIARNPTPGPSRRVDQPSDGKIIIIEFSRAEIFVRADENNHDEEESRSILSRDGEQDGNQFWSIYLHTPLNVGQLSPRLGRSQMV